MPITVLPPVNAAWKAFRLIAAATTNLQPVKAGRGMLGGWYLSNLNASPRYLKLYNGVFSAVTVGTTIPFLTISIPGGGACSLPVSKDGIDFDTAITMAVTTGIADTDATAVAASEIIINLFYY